MECFFYLPVNAFAVNPQPAQIKCGSGHTLAADVIFYSSCLIQKGLSKEMSEQGVYNT